MKMARVLSVLPRDRDRNGVSAIRGSAGTG